MRQSLLVLFALLALSAAPSTQSPEARTFTGTIQDFECAGLGHERMRMGPTDAECVRMCVLAHGVPYVLEVGQTVYFLSDQATPAEFAAQPVIVTGTLDAAAMTITVESIRPAES